MLNVNTIEFGGGKAVINSYDVDQFPFLIEDCNRQRELFAARFPKANVKTQRMSESDTRELVAIGGNNEKRLNTVWEIGKASEA